MKEMTSEENMRYIPNILKLQIFGKLKLDSKHNDIVLATSTDTGDFPGGSLVKNPHADAGAADWTPGPGKSSRDGNGNPLQYPCLGNPTDRGAWQVITCGVAELNSIG